LVLTGIVTDAKGDPIGGAKIHVKGIDHEIVTTDRGEYWRLLVPGDHELHVTASGFHPSEPKQINIRSTTEMHSMNFTLDELKSKFLSFQPSME